MILNEESRFTHRQIENLARPNHRRRTRTVTQSLVISFDLVCLRAVVRQFAQICQLQTIDEVKTVTAASELGRNTLKYGGGGNCEVSIVELQDGRTGIELIFEDRGPGIKDIDLALTDGYSTGNGHGLGLPGTQRLADEMSIDRQREIGTRLQVVKWKR